MPIQNEHEHGCSPPQPTDHSNQEMASSQRSHKHADVTEVNWPLDSVLKVASALIQMKELPAFQSNTCPQEERHAQVGGTCPSSVSRDKARATEEEQRISRQRPRPRPRLLFNNPGDPEFSSEEGISNRKRKRNAIAHALQKSRSNLLVTGFPEPKKTLSVYVRKRRVAPGCMKSERFDGRARSSAAPVVTGVTNCKRPKSGAYMSHTGKQPSQPPCAMEDGRDKRCTRPAQAVLSALETHRNLNRLGAQNVKRASLEMGEPSSAGFRVTIARSEPISAHPPGDLPEQIEREDRLMKHILRSNQCSPS